MKYRSLLTGCLLLLVVSTSSCVVLPMIDGVSQLGLSKNDREALLPKQVKKFQEGLYWGKPMEAIAMIKEENRETAGKVLRKDVEGIRIVESKVNSIDYADDSNKAKVELTIRHYKVPFYVVVDRVEEEQWEFSVSKGWQYVSRTITKES